MQEGSVTVERRKRGPDVWCFRWREGGPDGRRIHHRIVRGMQRSQNLNLAKSDASLSVDGGKMDCPWCGETVIPKSAKRE